MAVSKDRRNDVRKRKGCKKTKAKRVAFCANEAAKSVRRIFVLEVGGGEGAYDDGCTGRDLVGGKGRKFSEKLL
jgi:hypothetical protein